MAGKKSTGGGKKGGGSGGKSKPKACPVWVQGGCNGVGCTCPAGGK
jgi:hypothetical protein